MGAVEAAGTPWRDGPFRTRGPELIFGSMYEDCQVELRAFAPHRRVFCIAAAGCTALALAAAGHQVTAVDVNPKQIAYAQARARGQLPQQGSVDRLMTHGRRVIALCGWTRSTLTDFLALSDVAEQLDYFDRKLDTRAWRLLVDTLLSRRFLGLRYSQTFLQELPRDFGRQTRARLRRGLGRHANNSNPYAASLLLGIVPAQCGPPLEPIQFACAEAAAYLERCAPGSFDAFTLSNIADGTPLRYRRRLGTAIAGAAAAGAVVVTRTFADRGLEAGASQGEDWTARDRSLLWDVVRVKRLEEGEAWSIA